MAALRTSQRIKRAPSAPAAPTTSTSTASHGRKRKATVGAAAVPENPARAAKRQRASSAILNVVPSQKVDVYVCGTNCYGELGLGNLSRKSEFARPVLNANLAAASVGVVQVAVGGVHSVALTHDNKTLTWGVNDDAALGRDTKEDPQSQTQIKDEDMSDVDAKDESASSDDDDVSLNLKEATPSSVDSSLFPKGTVFAQLSATDSATFALTTDGLVYGWGTFRGNNGVIGFSPTNSTHQIEPLLLPGLTNVTKLASGAQHMLALTSSGTVYSWGCNEQSQLGRRRTSRSRSVDPLLPAPCALPVGIIDIGAGMYHSFAIQRTGAVYGWGSNNFGQLAISSNAGTNGAVITYPTRIRSLPKGRKLVQIKGGKDHSLAVTQDGACLTWGRIENKALGYDPAVLSRETVICDERNRPRISLLPHAVPSLKDVVFATTGTDHSFAIDKDGRAFSWGFNAQCQAGKPSSTDEIVLPILVDGKHVAGKKMLAAAAGGQFSILLGQPE